ncbi:hypothetical protein [Shewanella sp.]|uniref:hypothetical protein n=1 Tax=Shewanella sp. TaxID=50422 RepID=UPI003D0FCD80
MAIMVIPTLALIFLVLFALQFWSSLRLFHRPKPLLSTGFMAGRIDLARRFLAHAFAVNIPLYLVGWLTLQQAAVFSILFVSLALLITPELSLRHDAELVVTKPLFGHQVSVHLSNPFQDFTLQTYRELLALVEIMPCFGVTNIRLCSPMFYDANGRLRDFSLLERQLQRKNARLTNRPAERWQNLLGIAVLFFSRDPQKREKRHNIHLNSWHILHIHLRG